MCIIAHNLYGVMHIVVDTVLQILPQMVLLSLF